MCATKNLPALAGSRLVCEVVAEYLDWGRSQGRRDGKPWSGTHTKKKKQKLLWWQEELDLTTLADMSGLLPRTEKALQHLQQKGAKGKTLANYVEPLQSFSLWAIQRGYLAENPLAGMAGFDTTPETVRRSMTADEINRLLNCCASHRRLVYEVAFLSGLRANELSQLSVSDLNRKQIGIHLHAEWTKNRKPKFQPLPKDLVKRLFVFNQTAEAQRLYRKFYAR